MDGRIGVVRVGQIEHLYSGAESRVGAHNQEGRAARGLKMIFFHRAAKTHRKFVHGAGKTRLNYLNDTISQKRY
jgi:hypothetical protein